MKMLVNLVLTALYLWANVRANCPEIETWGFRSEVFCYHEDSGEQVLCTEEPSPEGTEARFTCLSGYKVVGGDVSWKCQPNETWTGNDALRCEAECGVPKSTETLPWHVSIFARDRENDDDIDYRHRCSGTLISDQIVVTSARCVTKDYSSSLIPTYDIDVNIGGTHNPYSPWVLKTLIHPKYEPYSLRNDVALILFMWPVELNEYVSPICISDDELYSEDLVVSLFKNSNGSVNVHDAYPKQSPLVDDEECFLHMDAQHRYQNYRSQPLSPDRFCSGYTASDVEPEPLCPAEWNFFEGACYHISHHYADWENASSTCFGIYLATIISEEENEFVSHYLRRDMWLGLQSVDGEWTWSDGSDVNFDNLDGWPGYDPSEHTDRHIDLEGRGEEAMNFNSNNNGSVEHSFVCKISLLEDLCPYEWEKFEESCYYFRDTRLLSWENAREACRDLNPLADLPSITSTTEYDFLKYKLQTRAWIGLNEEVDSNEYSYEGDSNEDNSNKSTRKKWRWNKYGRLDYENWAEGEPSEDNEAKCGLIDISGHWVSNDCQEKLPYVCKFDPYPYWEDWHLDDTSCNAGIGSGIAYKKDTESGEKWYLKGISSFQAFVDDGEALQCTEKKKGINVFVDVSFHRNFIQTISEYFSYFD